MNTVLLYVGKVVFIHIIMNSMQTKIIFARNFLDLVSLS